MVIKIDTKTKTERFLAQRPIWRLKLRLVEWIWPKKSHKTKNTIFDLYRGHGPISLASEAGHCSNLKIVPDLASLDRFKFFQWFLCMIFNPLSPPNASFDLKIFHIYYIPFIIGNHVFLGQNQIGFKVWFPLNFIRSGCCPPFCKARIWWSKKLKLIFV